MAYSSQSHCFDHNHPIGHFQQPTGSCVRFSIPQIETYQQLFSGLAGRGRPSRGLFCNDLQCHSRDYWKVEFRVSVFHRYRVSVYWSCMYHLAAVLQYYAGSLIFMK